MGAGAELRLELELGGNMIDVSACIVTAHGMAGRRQVIDPFDPGQAEFVLEDPDRDFDELNIGTRTYPGGTFDEGDLIDGAPVLVSLRPDGGAWVPWWRGTVTDIELTTYGGSDSNPRALITCRGVLSQLAQPLPWWPNDRIVDKFGRGRSTAFYSFNLENGTGDGRVEDFSGKAADGVAYTSDGVTKGLVSSAAGSIDFGPAATESIWAPLQRDTNRSASDGWLAAFVVELEGHSSPSGDFETWTLFSEGADEPATGSPASLRDGLQVNLREYRTGQATADSNLMALVVTAWENGKGAGAVVNFVGTRGDWIGHRRFVMVASSPANIQLSAMVLDGDGSIGGAAYDQGILPGGVFDVAGGPASRLEDEDRVFRIGRCFDFDPGGISGTAGETEPFQGAMELAAVGYVAGYTDPLVVLDGTETLRTMLESDLVDRVEQYRDAIGFDVAVWQANLAGVDLRCDEFVMRAGSSALDALRELVMMAHGRLCQRGGVVHVDDWSAAAARAAGGSHPTYTDQGDPDVDLAYLAGSAKVSTGRDLITNRCRVEAADGWSYTHEDAASVAKHGVREAVYSLPFASRAAAQLFAEHVVTRLSTQRAFVSELVVDPKGAASAAWWAEITARELGDRIDVVRQPGGVGTVATIPQVLEGRHWAFSAIDEAFEFTLYLSHADAYSGTYTGA